MELCVWTRVVLLMAVLWADSAGAQCGDQDPDCHLKGLDTSLLACNEVCNRGRSLEVPLFPGNGRLMPVAEALRSYVMGHFRWDKFGKKRGNSSRSARGVWGPRWASRELLGPREDKRSYSMEHFRWGKPVGRKRRPIKVYPNEDTSAEGLGDELKRQISAEAWGPGEAWGLGREIWGLGDKAWGPVQAQGPWGPGEETWGPEKETWGPGQETWVPGQEPEQKKDGKLYKMTHFRWAEGSKDGLRQAGSKHLLPMFPKTPEASLPQVGANEAEVEAEDLENELGPEEKKNEEDYKIGHFRWGSPLKDKRYGGFMNSWDRRPLLTLFRNVMGKEGPVGRGLGQ
ncbi:pro-opiomelanocortin [Callorhinchus milii]|nr:pro-opiomelanocortin [Callorhinchus milii]|eukprot:gi/632985306/ref/XP_007909605.1/ PREDICTED: pro-opiomelanocortin [Callorhinchus milii]